MTTLQGRVWKIDHDVAATDLFPARYDKLGMSRDWAACATHLLEDVAPGLVDRMAAGDVLVVDGQLGAGHAHYFGAAVNSCRHLGLAAVVARSINGMFFRSASDLGLTTWALPELVSAVGPADEITVDLAAGTAIDHTRGTEITFSPVPTLMLDVFAAGGTARWAMNRPDVRDRARRHAERRVES